MTPEDRFPGPEHPHSGPRHQPDLDVLPYGTYYEPEPAPDYQGAPYDAETYSGYGGARYLEQHWPADGQGQGQGHTVHAQGPGTDHGPADQSAVFSHPGQGDYEAGYETGYEGGYAPQDHSGHAEHAGHDVHSGHDVQDHPGYEPTLPDQPSPALQLAEQLPDQLSEQIPDQFSDRDDPPTIELGPPLPDPAAPTYPYPAPGPGEPPGPVYVVGDVHGYLEELRAELHHQGLIDADGHWSAGRARIWFLGDFTDRGPDGIGVIDLVMQLAAEAAAAGGYCRALMGNHELLFLGAHKYGDEPVQSTAGTASFLAAWRLNGGQQTDLDRLEAHHISWLSRLPAIGLEDGHLLLHSDTTAYLEYGESIPDVNDAVHSLLADGGVDEWWDCFRRFTKRFAFRGDAGPMAVHELLDTYGGSRIVHGHSPIPYLTGAVHADDGQPPHIPGPYVYADDLAVAMDGGVTMEGRLLVARLPI
ncbi:MULTISPECIES: metallophosphoesterase [Kitasatospora]|uniref:Serine/threonine protein phosphatase n=1 Tax=Kitasatospora cathayae TaxID=3004092 RepID=A0ABY7Q560_9ACTN|nr:metallophosphoesterase [Kitasatospora sp. HUAS 3-15]WBP87800.1 serine/threonine protein phosphatase [Kitasatospora sp. HUAS 3-15]